MAQIKINRKKNKSQAASGDKDTIFFTKESNSATTGKIIMGGVDYTGTLLSGTIGNETEPVYVKDGLVTKVTGIAGELLRGGLNSIGNYPGSVPINPAINGIAHCIDMGAVLRCFLDEQEIILPISTLKALFDGSAITYYTPLSEPATIDPTIVWNGVTEYIPGNIVGYKKADDYWYYYRCLITNTNCDPTTNTVNWEDISNRTVGTATNYSGIYPYKIDKITFILDLSVPRISIGYENSLILYWRTAGQHPKHVKVYKSNNGIDYTFITESDLSYNTSVHNFYLGTKTNGAEYYIKVELSSMQSSTYWCFAPCQFAVTGLIGGFERFALPRSGGEIFGDIYPYASTTVANLGNASKRFNSVYTKEVNSSGKVTASSFAKTGGTSSQFLKADGSVDNSTYLKSFTEIDPTVPSWAKADSKPEYEYSEIKNTPDIPEDTNLVHLSGDETITGKKTFNGSLSVPSDQDSEITGVGFSGTTNLKDKGYNIWFRSTAYNPIIGFKSGTAIWYFLANPTKLYLGPTSSLALWTELNGNGGIPGNWTAGKIIKSGGTASEFLKADGSVDSNTYLTGSGTNESLAKFNSDNTLTSGPSFITTNDKKYLRHDGTWQTMYADTVDDFHYDTFGEYKDLKTILFLKQLTSDAPITKAELLAKNNVNKGELYIVSDLDNTLWICYNKITLACTEESYTNYWRLVTSTYPLLETATDFIYVKVRTTVQYSSGFLKLVIQGKYDNRAGLTRSTVYGISRYTSGESLGYNGNNLKGFYQYGHYTEYFYLKFAKPVGDASGWGNLVLTQGTIDIYCNVNLTSIEIIAPSSSEYAEVSSFDYAEVPETGLFSFKSASNELGTWNDIKSFKDNTYSLGKVNNKWKNLYVTNINGQSVGDTPKFTDTLFDDSEVVHLYNDEIISGTKTFIFRPQVKVVYSEGHMLPSEYQEVNYIYTDGGAWIDTGIKGNMSYKYILDFRLNAGLHGIWGVFNQLAYQPTNMSLTYATGIGVRWDVNGNECVDNLAPLTDSNKHELIIDNGAIYFDGMNKQKSAGHQNNFQFDYNLFLGSINPGGNPVQAATTLYLQGYIYYYAVYDINNILILELIPCYRKSDNIVGMYDTVSKLFFVNANPLTVVTGFFTKGLNVFDNTTINYEEVATLADTNATIKLVSLLENDAEYITKTYFDTLIGDINSILENILGQS